MQTPQKPPQNHHIEPEWQDDIAFELSPAYVTDAEQTVWDEVIERFITVKEDPEYVQT